METDSSTCCPQQATLAAADLLEKSRKYGALANPYRLAILRLVATKGNASWLQLNRELETVFEKRINPNSLSFHLKKLIENQFLTQSGAYYRLGRLGSKKEYELCAIGLKWPSRPTCCHVTT